MYIKSKKFYSLLLAIAMVLTTAFTGYSPEITSAAVESSYADTAKAVDSQSTDVAQLNDYGLADSVGKGVILHCWNWSFSAIKDEMANIAAAGYTAVQTSPVQRAKDCSAGDSQKGSWWKVYQPTSLCFAPGGHGWFGTKEDFKAMCDEADKYGIKVIVDVVANHMANNKGGEGNCKEGISSQNDPTYRDDDSCWHLNGSTYIDYGANYRGNSKTSLTRGYGGWPDLNTGSSKVQKGVLGLLKECIDLGADGFRFDAAKHIELPTDPDGSDFWPFVINGAKSYAAEKNVTLYNYGEILYSPGTDISNYTKYMAVTEDDMKDDQGKTIRDFVSSGNAKYASNSSLHYSGQKSTDLVLWAESHDTYAQNGFTGPSVNISQSNINKTWAIVASRNFPSLYFVRPGSSSKMGDKSSNKSWKNKEVVEVNKFHNFYYGKSEYLGHSGSIVYDVRNKDGVVLVNVSGNSTSVDFSLSKTGMADGEYKDQISGNKFTVSSGRITGNIGDTGIAVVYNAVDSKLPAAKASVADGTKFTDSLDVTISLSNATSGTYKIDEGSATTFASSKTIKIGADTAEGSSVKLTLTATDGKKTTTTTYTYYKKIQGQTYTAWFKKPSGWGSTIYCYAYDDDVEPTVKNAKWPGVKMTLDSESGYYKYEIPSDIESPKVIFNDNNNQVPGANKPGFEFTSPSMIYKDGKWQDYDVKGTVIVNYVDESGKTIAEPSTLTGTVGSSYKTSAKDVSGYTLKTTPGNATGKFTSETIKVSYVYKVSDGNRYVTPVVVAGDKQIKVTWNVVNGATNYRVFTYVDGTYTKIKDTTKTSYTITGLTNGKKYGVYVIAYIDNKWVGSGTSYIRYATPAATGCIVPELIKGDKQIKVMWSAVSGTTNYRVFTYIDGVYTKIKDTTNTSYTITGLTNGKKYGVYVIAYIDNKWVGSGTSYIRYATPEATGCVIPSLVIGDKQIKVTWSAVNGATNYRVFTYVDGVYTKIKDTTNTSYTITGLTNGKKYGVYVIAYIDNKWVGSGTSYIKYATPEA